MSQLPVLRVQELTSFSCSTPEQAQKYFNHTQSTISSAAAISSLQCKRNNDLIYRLEKAQKQENGPAMLAAAEEFNVVMRMLKGSGEMRKHIEQMSGVHEKLWT